MDNEDQVQGTGEEGSEVETEGTTDEQETQEQGQSNETEGAEGKEGEELFELPDGRKVDPKTLSKEWKDNFYPEFTRRSQKLRDYERSEQERQVKAEEAARKATSEEDIAKGVPPDVREAIVTIMKPEFEKWISEQQKVQAQKEADTAFEEKLSSLEKEFPGKEGLPKFDRNQVLRAMQDPDNKNFDPKSKFLELHQEAFDDFKIKQALKRKSGSLSTEATGQDSGERKPEAGKSPTSFEEAAKRFSSRLKGE